MLRSARHVESIAYIVAQFPLDHFLETVPKHLQDGDNRGTQKIPLANIMQYGIFGGKPQFLRFRNCPLTHMKIVATLQQRNSG